MEKNNQIKEGLEADETGIDDIEINDPILRNKDVWTVDEAARYLRVEPKTIYVWIDHGHLEAEKIAGSVLRIPKSSIKKCRFAGRARLI